MLSKREASSKDYFVRSFVVPRSICSSYILSALFVFPVFIGFTLLKRPFIVQAISLLGGRKKEDEEGDRLQKNK